MNETETKRTAIYVVEVRYTFEGHEHAPTFRFDASSLWNAMGRSITAITQDASRHAYDREVNMEEIEVTYLELKEQR